MYLAAPLFSQAERVRKSLRDAISSFANVYLPQEDGGLILDFVRDGMSVEEAKAKVFQLDINAIAACDVLVIVLDGRHSSWGTLSRLERFALVSRLTPVCCFQ
ncbi:nucleoside 2-deoxyribosyltransferase [Bradyrhizobium arachidis]|uniref:nucleoside 2-deoxyribosyltransferase n=1 Tax=Bradyrhizobium TaxID=374 RepID=UPI003D315EE7